MLTIIHGADFHLDSPFSGLSPQLAAQRRREQRTLLSRLCALTKERQADLLLLSGDLFDGEKVYPETVEMLAEELAALSCPVLIAPGNHDHYSSRSPYATTKWSENVHIFSTEQVEAVEFPALRTTVYGAAFCAPHMAHSPLDSFSIPQEGDFYRIMTLHGALDGTDYAPISQETIAQSGLHYLALGHIHAHSGLQRAGNTCYAYPGCPEGRGFDELGEKGVLCVTLDQGNCTSEFIPLCQRRYEISTIDVTDVDTILSAIQDALPPSSTEDSYRILLTGTAQEVDIPSLMSALSPHFFSLDIRDHTRPPRDIWSGKGEDNLRGLFLSQMIELGAEHDSSLLLALKFGLAALEQREDIAP